MKSKLELKDARDRNRSRSHGELMLIVFLLIACQAAFYTTQNFMSMDGTELCVDHLTPIINQENLTDLPTGQSD